MQRLELLAGGQAVEVLLVPSPPAAAVVLVAEERHLQLSVRPLAEGLGPALRVEYIQLSQIVICRNCEVQFPKKELIHLLHKPPPKLGIGVAPTLHYLGAHLQDGLDEDPEVGRGDAAAAVPPLVLLVQDGLLHLLESLPGGGASPAAAAPALPLPVREERGQAVEDVPAQSPDRLVTGPRVRLRQVVGVVVAGVEAVEGELLQDEVDDAERGDDDVSVGGGDWAAAGPRSRRLEQGLDK